MYREVYEARASSPLTCMGSFHSTLLSSFKTNIHFSTQILYYFLQLRKLQALYNL